MDLAFRQLGSLRGHLVDLAVVDHVDDGVLTPSVQPDVVRQVGRAHGVVALAVHAVAGRASTKLGLAQLCAQRVVWASRQAQHIVRHVAHVIGCAHCSSHGRHIAHAPLHQGRFDRIGCAAIQPIGIRQVGEAFAAACIRAVALRAVVHEQAVANGQGLRVLGHFFGRHPREFGIQRGHFGIAFGHFGLVLTGR